MKHIKTINEVLKYKTRKIISVNDWDNLVSETYGKVYSFQQQDGCQDRGTISLQVPSRFTEDEEMNDSIPEIINGNEMGVKFEVWLGRDPRAPLNPTDQQLRSCNYYWGKTEQDKERWKNDIGNINLFWERNFYPDINTLANDLYEKGLIEEGEYLIDIDW